MAEDVKVNPNPIQRNIRDVAFELSKLYLDKQATIDIEKVQSTYIKMHAAAAVAETKLNNRKPNQMVSELIPEELR